MTIAARLLLVGLLAVVVAGLAACSAAAAPTDPPPATDRQTPEPTPPVDDGREPGEPGDGGGEPGQPAPVPPDGQLPGQPRLVVPVPGQQMVHPVPASELLAQVEDGHILLNVRWWSGVEPCAVLDSVDVRRDGTTFTVTLLEGTSDVDSVCIAVAVEKVTALDLGRVDPGTYTVRADPGDAPPLTVQVP